MPQAKLKSQSISHSAIDEATGVISGCKLMQVGKTAHFKRADGVADSFEITPELIKGLLAHAGNRSIPCHFTHDSDDLHARLGLHKNIRIDEAGDLASDLHTMPNEYGKLAMWTAKTDPNSAAFSAVFQYNPIKDGNRKLAVPLSFEAADLVSVGAACSAMLSAIPTDTDMTKEEIQAIVSDSIKAALADFKPAIPAALSKEDVGEIVKASLSAYAPTITDAQLAELSTKAEASVVAKLGSGPLQVHIGDAKRGSDYTAKLSEYVKTSPNRATAVARLLKDCPEMAEAHESAVRVERAALTA